MRYLLRIDQKVLRKGNLGRYPLILTDLAQVFLFEVFVWVIFFPFLFQVITYRNHVTNFCKSSLRNRSKTFRLLEIRVQILKTMPDFCEMLLHNPCHVCVCVCGGGGGVRLGTCVSKGAGF